MRTLTLGLCLLCRGLVLAPLWRAWRAPTTDDLELGAERDLVAEASVAVLIGGHPDGELASLAAFRTAMERVLP